MRSVSCWATSSDHSASPNSGTALWCFQMTGRNRVMKCLKRPVGTIHFCRQQSCTNAFLLPSSMWAVLNKPEWTFVSILVTMATDVTAELTCSIWQVRSCFEPEQMSTQCAVQHKGRRILETDWEGEFRTPLGFSLEKRRKWFDSKLFTSIY